MAWTEVTFIVNRQNAETLSDLMHESGAVAVTMKEGGEDKIFEPAPGETPLWQDTQVVGLFELDQNVDHVIESLKKAWQSSQFPEYRIGHVPDQDWERAWLADFKPMKFGNKLWIIPSTFEPEDDDGVNIFLDPGLAFGTGTHATTALCLRWLDENHPEDQRVIDYGCGSGVLAIAAAKTGASEIHAVDIDPQALDATISNSEKNQVQDQIKCYLPQQFSIKAADLLLANILANPLIELAESFSTMVKLNGKIVLSGILKDQADSVLAEYKKWFEMDEPQVLDGWVLLTGKK